MLGWIQAAMQQNTITQDEVGTGNVNAMQIFLITAKEIFHQYQPRVGE